MLIPHITMTPESKLKLTFDFPSSCFFVIVGGKYLNRIGSVMKKVNSITNDIGGTRPMAVYIMSNTNEDDLDIDIDNYIILVVIADDKYCHSSCTTNIIYNRIHFLHNRTYFV